MQRTDLLVWIDLEMTGLDPRTDLITEIATVITDSNLEIVAEGPDLVLHVDNKAQLQALVEQEDFPMNADFAEEIQKSTVSTKGAERQTLDFVQTHVTKHTAPLCGNSIHMDRFFLMHHMPMLHEYLHYRNIDVSSVKELARRWKPEAFEQASAQKSLRHRAKDDILESIEELRFYQDNFFK